MSTSPLQPLPTQEASLVNDLLLLNLDLPALAAKRHRPLPDLISWSLSAPIQAYIAAFQFLANISRALRESKRLTTALDNTESLIASTTDPVQKRLLLNNLIRGSTALLNPRLHTDQPIVPRACRPTAPVDEPAPSPTHKPASPAAAPPLEQDISSYLNTIPYQPIEPDTPLNFPTKHKPRQRSPATLLATAGL